MLSDLSPLLGAILFDQMKNHPIFFVSPRALDQIWVKDLLPPVEALHVSPSRKALRDLLPVFASILSDSLLKNLIFFLGPVSFHRDPITKF
jgi:uncharacterized membrane protein